jgi:hypothetical protein
MRRAVEKHIKETDQQAQMVDALRLCGFTVYETQTRRVAGKSGVDRGVPDLLIAHPLVHYCLCGLEVKRPVRGRFSAEQSAAVAARHYKSAKNSIEALAIVREWFAERCQCTDEPAAEAVFRKLKSVQLQLGGANG